MPQVNINDDFIQNEIKKMNLSGLPNYMTVIPVHMVNDNEKKLNVYSLEECDIIKDNEKEKNLKNMESLINIQNVFNNKYKKYLNIFYGDDKTYEFSKMNSFCNSFIPSYADGRELIDLKNTGINIEEFANDCFEIKKLNYRDYLLGGGKNNFDKLESSKLMREMIHLLKKRVDDDINNVTEIKYDDYSKPKMMMISSHDSTMSCYEMFFINCFKLNLDYFKLTKYTAQMAFEISRKDDDEINIINKLGYKDYTVNYYFNDDKLFSTSLDDFIEKIENYLWTDEEVNNYCSASNDKDDDKYLIYVGIICVISVLFVIFLVATIILVIVNKRLKNANPDTQISLMESS